MRAAGGKSNVTVLAGGVGAARFLRGLLQVVPAEQVTAVVNVGDDLVLHGLHISPDLDTITYTLAGQVDDERGWGLKGETWQAMETVGRYGGIDWFNLGDRDLGTHLYRTQRLRDEGATLTEVTAEITSAWDLGLRVLPVSDDPVRTRLTLTSGEEVAFQDYFVRLRHGVPVTSMRLDGLEAARPGPDVLAAIADADAVVIAPSNPVVSIAPVLAVPGVQAAVEAVRGRTVAVSPLIGGKTVKGPADRLMHELGMVPTSVGVAHAYRDVASALVLDTEDAGLAADVEAEGLTAVVTPSLMSDDRVAADLARTTLAAVGVQV
jgi:LPPG:FO 2-phospho-L-lactate transferase